MERPTTELTLPESKAKIVIYSFLTGGDFRKIQRQLLKDLKITEKQVQSGNFFEDISASVGLDQQDLVLEFLIKEATDSSGKKVENIKEFVYNLSIPDSNFLYQTSSKITAGSNLSKELKKK